MFWKRRVGAIPGPELRCAVRAVCWAVKGTHMGGHGPGAHSRQSLMSSPRDGEPTTARLLSVLRIKLL